MKSFGLQPWIFPQAVLMSGTHDRDGRPNADWMGIITGDSVSHACIRQGKTVGKAFEDGKRME